MTSTGTGSGGRDRVVGAEASVVSADAPSIAGAALCKCAGSVLGDASGVGRAGLVGVASCTGGPAEEVTTAAVSFSFSAFGRGGHSRFSFTSSRGPSPARCDTGVPVRGGMDVKDCRFVCCSNRPMRFATLWRGLSSGRGL